MWVNIDKIKHVERHLINRNLLFGFLTWLIPFTISIAFFKSGGSLAISFELFKSIMVIISALTGSTLLYLYFSAVKRYFIMNGWIIGLSWLSINLILDFFIKVPMMHNSFKDFFSSFGLLYGIYPIVTVTIGMLLEKISQLKPEDRY